MLTLLVKLFVKDKDNLYSPTVRVAYGTLCSVYGMVLNLLLFAGKFFAGTVTGSISITADAFNNLSDTLSGVISLVGFKESEKEPDPEHPFGHGRIEYVSGLIISFLVILMGAELVKESVNKIIHPEPVTMTVVAYVILAVSIGVKLYMAWYNKRIGKKIDSGTLKAVAVDSISDVFATSVVLISGIIGQYTGINIDAYTGLAVAALIFYAGMSSVKDTVSPLLGDKPSPEFVDKIISIVTEQPDIIGIHDLIVHDYGPGRQFVTLHAEVPGNKDIYELHDEIDVAERNLIEKLHCHAVIHMDPICTSDEEVFEMKKKVQELVSGYNSGFTIHDFRMVPGNTHTNLVFDVVVTNDYPEKKFPEIEGELKKIIEENCKDCYAVMNLEHSYI